MISLTSAVAVVASASAVSALRIVHAPAAASCPDSS